MENKIDEIRNFFAENLKAKECYQQLHKDLLTVEDFFVFVLKFLHDVMQSGRFSGRKMLEIGSGPTVHNIAAASAHFSTIIQSDFVEDNREQLKKWLRGQPDHFDWSHFLELAARVEGIGSDPMTALQIISTRIRKSVKGVIKCDVLSDTVIFLTEKSDPERSPPYDLAISIWCIENVAPDFDSYVGILKKINNLLRPGGGIIMAGFINRESITVGGKVGYCVKLSVDDVANALKLAGFNQQDFRVQERSVDFRFDYDGLFCVAAEKQT